ncbi:MAG: hypothetical protein ABI579_08455 [Candidatus Sumerlaeota bacterium]
MSTTNLDAMIAHLDDVIEESRAGVVAIHHKELQGEAGQVTHRIARCAAAIERYAPTKSIYRRLADDALKLDLSKNSAHIAERLFAVITALRDDAIIGKLADAEESIRTDLLTDMVGMAERLLDDGFKDPAAIVMGTVLAEKLKKLCEINCLSTEWTNGSVVIPKNVQQMNDALFDFDIYAERDRDLVTRLNDLRLKALKGENVAFTPADTATMLKCLREFLDHTSTELR